MSDSLRDRIAVALRGHGPMGAYYRDGLEFCSCGAETDGLLEFEAHLADAVIRELNADLLDFGEWLCEELNSVKISRIDLQSCLDDWRAISPAPQCNSDPEAPHGFDRSASQDEDRYVCECEGWVADDA